jgi:hypothetical protein
MLEIENPINSILPVIAQTVADWKKENTAEIVRQRTQELLEKNSDAIVYQLLGFAKDRWDGKWAVDFTNGRQANSAAGDYIRTQQIETIKEWLAQVPMPKLTHSSAKSISKNLASQYSDQLRRKLSELVNEQAEADAERIFKNLSDPAQINAFMKALKLISPEGT